jgi:prolyl 4-hydroxylase
MCQYTILLLLAGLIIFALIWFDCNNTRTNKKKTNEKFTSLTNSNNLIQPNPIQLIDEFLSPDVCDKLIELSNSRFTKSTIYASNRGEVDTNARSSSCAYFNRGENEIIKSIEDKVCSMLSIDKKQIEPLQIVKYEKGQQYKYHHDYFGNETDQVKNQRVYSILVYLNDLNEIDGGSTHFPLLRIKTYPYKGRAVLWNNLRSDGIENNLTLHAGEPVLTDQVKYVLTIWTRMSDY